MARQNPDFEKQFFIALKKDVHKIIRYVINPNNPYRHALRKYSFSE
jgi:hypothetical protein